MTPTDIAIGAAVVSFGSMCAAIASAVFARRNARIAEEAKRQAKQAALLERRTEAIEHIRQALFDVNNNRSANQALGNIRKAMNLSELAFGHEVRDALNQVEAKALHLNSIADKRKEPEFQNTLVLLGKELEALLKQMNRETAL
jgi:folylpolyglutamate synthase/dihydropteroate synthase